MPGIDPIRFEHFEVYLHPDGAPVELGRGAMGVTYKAFDTSLHVDVALKVINDRGLTNPTARKRFEREARAAAQLRHPNIAAVSHFGAGESSCYYAMELVEGETIEQLLRRNGPLGISQALGIVLQVSRALRAAEKQNIVHRDLKPANIMLTESDGEMLVKVIDFGLAKQTGNPGDAGVTLRGFVGTPHFASPEQLNEQTLDTRSDIYSLGATLWLMLIGRPPFTGTVVQIVTQHLATDPPEHLLSDLPPAVKDLLLSMLSKDPEDRPSSASELRQRTAAALMEVQGKAPEVNFSDAAWSGIGVSSTFAEPATPSTAPQSVTPADLRPPHPHETRPTRSFRSFRSLSVRLSIGAAAAVVITGGSIFGFRHFRNPSEPVKEPFPVAATVVRETVDFAEKIQAATQSGDVADAITWTALAWPPVNGSTEQLNHLVDELSRDERALGSFRSRMAILDAAEAGSPVAMVAAGNLVADTYPHRAMIWYEKAAGTEFVPAMNKLGLLCAKGFQGYPPDLERAARWFERSAQAGDPDGLFALAECYLRGVGTGEKDETRAVELLKQAAVSGHARALDLLGTCYSKGIGTSRNYHEAFRCYERAVAAGHIPSLGNLGVLYMTGHGPSGEPDTGEAVKLFRRGAEAGDSGCMTFLATCFEEGHGVEPDREEAIEWYRKAATAGNARAADWCRKNGIDLGDEPPQS